MQNAYEVLSDDGKRRAYDMHGHAGVDQSAAAEEAEEAMRRGGMGGMGGMAGDFASAEEVFERFFGGGGPGGGRARRGGGGG